MSRKVFVTIEFGAGTVGARWGIGSDAAGQLCWEAPGREPDGPAFHETEDGHALVLEVLALAHLPNVDALVLALPAGEVDAHRARLEQAYTGVHDVRNSECRSQRLKVHVRRVDVVATA